MIGPNVCRKKVLLFCIKTLKFALFSNNNESRQKEPKLLPSTELNEAFCKTWPLYCLIVGKLEQFRHYEFELVHYITAIAIISSGTGSHIS